MSLGKQIAAARKMKGLSQPQLAEMIGVSPEAISTFLSERMIGQYGTHNEAGKRVHREDFPQALAEAVKQTGPEGIGCSIGYHELTLWMPRQLFPSEDSSLMEIIYYDELQDILSDRYTEVW